MEYLQEVDNYTARSFPRIKSRYVVSHFLEMEKQLYTSTGAASYQKIPRALVIVKLTMEKDGQPVELVDTLGTP